MNRFHQVLFITLLFSAPFNCQKTDQRPVQQPSNESNGEVHELRLVSKIKGWFVIEDSLPHYEYSPDRQIKHGGDASAHIKSISAIAPAGVLRQTIKSDHYRGEHVRFSGYVKGKVEDGWAGLWMRIDGENGQRLSMDNMQNRPIKGTTDWRKYEIVLDVPLKSIALTFGVVLAGKGEIWADDLRLESAGPEDSISDIYGKGQTMGSSSSSGPTTGTYARRLLADLRDLPLEPTNLDFEAKR